MREWGSVPEIGNDVGCGKGDHGQKGHENRDKEPALRDEIGSSQLVGSSQPSASNLPGIGVSASLAPPGAESSMCRISGRYMVGMGLVSHPTDGTCPDTDAPSTAEAAAMDQFLFHPKVVHLPIALALLMPLLVGGVALAWWRGWLDRRAWVIVVLLQATLVGSGLVAMNTGEAEEERVEEVVAESHIESHEEAAEAFVWGSAAVLLVTLLPLVLSRGRMHTAAVIGACVGTLVVLGLGYRTGEAGGRLVYQYGAASAYVGAAGASTLPQSPDSAEDADDD